jgi:hypothetical protein
LSVSTTKTYITLIFFEKNVCLVVYNKTVKFGNGLIRIFDVRAIFHVFW